MPLWSRVYQQPVLKLKKMFSLVKKKKSGRPGGPVELVAECMNGGK